MIEVEIIIYHKIKRTDLNNQMEIHLIRIIRRNKESVRDRSTIICIRIVGKIMGKKIIGNIRL